MPVCYLLTQQIYNVLFQSLVPFFVCLFFLPPVKLLLKKRLKSSSTPIYLTSPIDIFLLAMSHVCRFPNRAAGEKQMLCSRPRLTQVKRLISRCLKGVYSSSAVGSRMSSVLLPGIDSLICCCLCLDKLSCPPHELLVKSAKEDSFFEL